MFNIIFSKLSKFVLLPTLKKPDNTHFFQINKFGTLKYRTQGISFIFSKRKETSSALIEGFCVGNKLGPVAPTIAPMGPHSTKDFEKLPSSWNLTQYR